MSILIVSANPLFKEVIAGTIAQFQTEYIELDPEEAVARIHEFSPEVILLDETIATTYFESLLAEARGWQKSRIIVLNPDQNGITLLNSRRAILRTADDLLEAISSSEYEIQLENDGCTFASSTG